MDDSWDGFTFLPGQPPSAKVKHQIKREYVFGVAADPTIPYERRYPTMRELAEKYHTDHWVIGRWSSREGWLAMRRKYEAILANEMCREEARRELSEVKGSPK
jgi:hypothetical protein